MRPLDKLIKDYKLETRRMAKQSIEQKIGNYIGYLVGMALLAILFNYILIWTTGVNVPWFLDYFVTLVFIGFGGRRLIAVYWMAFTILLVLWYLGLTPILSYILLIRALT